MKCTNCEVRSTKAEAAAEFDAHHGYGISYKDEITGVDEELCGGCAIEYMDNVIRSQDGYVEPEEEDDGNQEDDSDANLGRAIQMMNGDEDYDDDFVQEHL